MSRWSNLIGTHLQQSSHVTSQGAHFHTWLYIFFFFFVTITTNLITQHNIDRYLCIFDLILFPSYLSRHLFVTQTAVTPCHSLETPQEVCPLDGEKKLTAPSSSLLVRLRVRQSLRKELWFNPIWAGVAQQCLPNKCPGAQSTQRDDDDFFFFFFSIFLYLNDSCKPRVPFAPTRTFVCVCVSFLTLCVTSTMKAQQQTLTKRWKGVFFFGRRVRHKWAAEVGRDVLR